jgi:hypothetical protein
MSSVLNSARASSTQNSESSATETPLEKPALVLRKGWTLGDSNALVDGHPQESKIAGLLWIVVPTMLALAVIYFMMPR